MGKWDHYVTSEPPQEFRFCGSKMRLHPVCFELESEPTDLTALLMVSALLNLLFAPVLSLEDYSQ